MSSSTDIWSTRLQRELVALTKENEELFVEGTDKVKNNHVGVLPEFLKYKEHNLDIEKGTCTVSFILSVDVPSSVSSESASTSTATNSEENLQESTTETETETESESKSEPTPTPDPTPTPTTLSVTITLDASLTYKEDNPDTSISYPFRKPKALITEGSEHLPPGSNIENGDEIDIDCDWTPSLHLNDAVINIALKVREGIKRGEPCFKTEPFASMITASVNESTAKVANFFANLRTKASEVADELDAAVNSRPASASTAPSAVSPASAGSEKSKPKLAFRRIKAAEIKGPVKEVTAENVEAGDVIDLSQAPWCNAVGMYPCKALRRPEFMVAGMSTSDAASEQTKVRGYYDDDEDEEEDNAPCDNYMYLQAGGIRKVAGSGLTSARSMFSSFTQSAKNLVEEAFLMLTEELILEIRCNKFSVANATVTFVIPISYLSKLKFRRQESISLFFKQDPDSPVIYMCVSSADAVKQIQNILKRKGVSGKHTNATMQRTIQSAMELFKETQAKETALETNTDPQRENVTVIMDLYRQAAEKFELAGDARHEEVMAKMKAFLAKPFVAAILDDEGKKEVPVPEGEILEAVPDDDDDLPPPQPSAASAPTSTTEDKDKAEPKAAESAPDDAGGDGGEDFQKAMEAAEEMLKGAHDDLKDLGIDDLNDDDDEFGADITEGLIKESDGADDSGMDVVSEFEDMLKDADKELAELMGS